MLEDRLQTMIEAQRDFMDIVGIRPNSEIGNQTVLGSEEFRSASVGLVSEAVEILNMHNTKSRPWKSAEEFEEKFAHTKEELIDVMFYALEMFNILGMDAQDVVNEYVRKYSINCARILQKTCSRDELRKMIEVTIINFPESLWDESRGSYSCKDDANNASVKNIVTYAASKMDYDSLAKAVNDLADDPVTFLREL